MTVTSQPRDSDAFVTMANAALVVLLLLLVAGGNVLIVVRARLKRARHTRAAR